MEQVRLLAIVQERIPWALVETLDSTHVNERSAEIKPEDKLNKSVSFNYYFFECTLHDT